MLWIQDDLAKWHFILFLWYILIFWAQKCWFIELILTLGLNVVWLVKMSLVWMKSKFTNGKDMDIPIAMLDHWVLWNLLVMWMIWNCLKNWLNWHPEVWRCLIDFTFLQNILILCCSKSTEIYIFMILDKIVYLGYKSPLMIIFNKCLTPKNYIIKMIIKQITLYTREIWSS